MRNEDRIERIEETIIYNKDLFNTLGRTLNELEVIEVNATTEKDKEIDLVEKFNKALDDLKEYYDTERTEIDNDICEGRIEIDGLKGVRYYEKE